MQEYGMTMFRRIAWKEGVIDHVIITPSEKANGLYDFSVRVCGEEIRATAAARNRESAKLLLGT